MKPATTDPRRGATRGAEPAVWALVGETPLIPLELEAAERASGTLFLKAEWMNPGGSVKDRPARGILRAGLAEGVLPTRRLLDASSGNTAAAYAMLGAAAGIGVTVCVPRNASAERFQLLKLYGAEVIPSDPLEGSDGAIRLARQLAEASPDRYWYANQYDHPANPESHYQTTGPEIWNGTNGTITHLVAGVGTSGTLMGTGRFLREMKADVRLIAVEPSEPSEPFHGLEGLKHMATALVPGIYDPSTIDRTIFVGTESAEDKVRALAQDQGLFVGWSVGAAVIAAESIVAETGNGASGTHPVVVVIAPDGGTRYLSEARRLVSD